MVGVPFHVASGIAEGHTYAAAIGSAKGIKSHPKTLSHPIAALNIGSGFNKASFPSLAKIIRQALADEYSSTSNIRVIAEPDTYFAETTFTLVRNFIGKRHISFHDDTIGMIYLHEGVGGSFTSLLCNYPKVCNCL